MAWWSWSPGRVPPVAWGVLTALAALMGGCAAQRAPDVTLTPTEKLELENRALDLLVRAAEHPDPIVRCNAFESLVEISPRDGRPLFRRALLADAPLVRYGALVALGELRACGPLEAIIAALQDENRHVRLAAAFAAYRCGKPGAARILAETLTDSPDEDLRADAAALIGRLEEPQARRWLEVALKLPINRESKRVQLQIHAALAQIGVDESVRELAMYAQGDAPTRTEALLLLAQLGDSEARDALRYRLHGPSEDYDEARLIAARGLGRIGSDEGLELAMRMVTFSDPRRGTSDERPDRTFAVRSMAIHALAEIGDLRALPPLRTIAADESSPRLQVAAAYAICKILKVN